jgi:hypothetical protein
VQDATKNSESVAGGKMSWKQDLDDLMGISMEIVRESGRPPNSCSRHMNVIGIPISNSLTPAVEPRPVPLPMVRHRSERDEIMQRVANFKAHQQRMTREREDYYSQVRAAILSSLRRHDD